MDELDRRFDINFKTRNFSYLIYFSLVQIVDKTKICKDVHENNDNTFDTNLVLASDDTETTSEAFEEEDDLAVREIDQKSREYGKEDPPWIRDG